MTWEDITSGHHSEFYLNFSSFFFCKKKTNSPSSCSLLIAYTLSSSSAIAQLLNIISPGQQIRVPIAGFLF
jgi:hypothetical protein